ncbi:hypothetical protein LCGC14_0386140 [marine sediment metagenome]|uniref:Uncharacterized protein n=1 Tax=marine sediment metagenome TaxID=412755 RepID=A0A0F9T0U9_9ZZZZ
MTTKLEQVLSVIAPGKSFRELWKAKNIIGTAWLSSVPGGQPVTLTNEAAKRTTADGLLFHGAATDNVVISNDAGQNAKAAAHFTFEFTPTQLFSSASSADEILFRKEADGTHYMTIYLNATDGKLTWKFVSAGTDFTLTSTTASWTAGVKYIITVTLNDAPVQRLLVNGTLEDSDTATAALTPNGGDIIIGSSSDGGTDGVKALISRFVMGIGATATIGLTTTADTGEEALLNKGFPPATAKVQYLLTLDEGRGLTANNRGSGVGNGTIDTGPAWVYSGPKQAVMSLDGINDYAVGPALSDISGDISFVWVGKMMSTYNTAVSRYLAHVKISTNDEFALFYSSGDDAIQWYAKGAGGSALTVNYTTKPAIGDYWIIIATYTVAGALELMVNGPSRGTSSGGGAMSGAVATIYLGSKNTAVLQDVSSPILFGTVNGALSAQEGLNLSRYLNNWLGLGLTI